MDCCPYCNKTYLDCLKEDEKLKKPFDSFYLSQPAYYKYNYIYQSRHYVCLAYSLGAYNYETNVIYSMDWLYKTSKRKFIDQLRLLPECIWFDPKVTIQFTNDFNYLINQLQSLNIKKLSITEEYQQILITLLFYDDR